MKLGKKSFDFHSRFIDDFLFSNLISVHESNPVPSRVNEQFLHISTKIEQSFALSSELKIGHV